MVNEPSVDALSITLTVSAFVEMDMPTARLKMMLNDLETNATAGGVDDGQEASPEIKAFFARMMRTRII